jgi:hypothetical protein
LSTKRRAIATARGGSAHATANERHDHTGSVIHAAPTVYSVPMAQNILLVMRMRPRIDAGICSANKSYGMGFVPIPTPTKKRIDTNVSKLCENADAKPNAPRKNPAASETPLPV